MNATVPLGVRAWSFRALRPKPGDDGVDTLIQALIACDARDCELAAPLVEAAYGGPVSAHHSEMSAMTPQMMRRELRKWRLRTPVTHFEKIGARFQQAGIRVSAYGYSPDSTFTDDEIDRGFAAATALGADIITTSMTAAIAKRVAPFADKHRMAVALPAAIAAALPLSPYFKIAVDAGGSTGGHPDPVAFIKEHHTRIGCVFLKDCRGKAGDADAWSDADTSARDVLRLLRQEHWPIRAYLDYDDRGAGTAVDDVKRCLAGARQALS